MWVKPLQTDATQLHHATKVLRPTGVKSYELLGMSVMWWKPRAKDYHCDRWKDKELPKPSSWAGRQPASGKMTPFLPIENCCDSERLWRRHGPLTASYYDYVQVFPPMENYQEQGKCMGGGGTSISLRVTNRCPTATFHD